MELLTIRLSMIVPLRYSISTVLRCCLAFRDQVCNGCKALLADLLFSLRIPFWNCEGEIVDSLYWKNVLLGGNKTSERKKCVILIRTGRATIIPVTVTVWHCYLTSFHRNRMVCCTASEAVLPDLGLLYKALSFMGRAHVLSDIFRRLVSTSKVYI